MLHKPDEENSQPVNRLVEEYRRQTEGPGLSGVEEVAPFGPDQWHKFIACDLAGPGDYATFQEFLVEMRTKIVRILGVSPADLGLVQDTNRSYSSWPNNLYHSTSTSPENSENSPKT